MHGKTHEGGEGSAGAEYPGAVPKTAFGLLYLLVLSVAIFWFKDLRFTLAAIALQPVLIVLGRGKLGGIARSLRKLFSFSVVVLLSYLLAGESREGPWALGPITFYLGNLAEAGLMIGRVLAIVWASQALRALLGEAQFKAGLGGLPLPGLLPELLQAGLSALEDAPRKGGGDGSGGGRGGGRGEGNGGGRGRSEEGADGGRTKQSLVQWAKSASKKLEKRLVRMVRVDEDLPAERRDVLILTGVLVVLLGIKALKIFPGLPFAPGHKGVVIIPLYLVARSLTKHRWATTQLGITFGLLSFLIGDGKYGPFEIAKHITPGIVADLMWPVLRRQRGVVAYTALGLVLAATRWSTVLLVLLAVQVPEATLLAFLPVGLVHLVFGGLSGVVSAGAMGAIRRDREGEIREPT